MNDLNVINRKNSEAVEAYALKEAQSGKWVNLKYTGLHFVDYTAHDTERDRNAAAIDWTNAAPSNVSKPLNPKIALAA
jgi:hypothetical protein